MATISEPDRPPLRLYLMEGPALVARFYRAFGRLGERGPPDGTKLMVIPGFVASDRTTLGLQRALAKAGFRVTGWGMGLNLGVRADTRERLAEKIASFGGGEKITLVGWSLGGVYAREVAKMRPDLVERVITMGAPFSGDPRGNNVWRFYEMVAGHPVDAPPVELNLAEKPPVPTLAIWSRRDGIISIASARGAALESDRQLELDCSHMGFAVSGRAFPKIVAAVREFVGSGN
jgi:pimeloyl-ACP methyl ester carboxylesterase